MVFGDQELCNREDREEREEDEALCVWLAGNHWSWQQMGGTARASDP